jgi:hypothetical protein
MWRRVPLRDRRRARAAAVKLVITILQFPKRKLRVISDEIGDLLMSDMRQIFEVEQRLNSLPGTSLRWHFNIEESHKAKS